MADISKIKLPDGNTYDVKDTSKSSATNWVNGSSTGSVRTVTSAAEDSSYTIGSYAVTEGYNTKANGYSAHAEGYNSIASGDFSHVEGYSTTASNGKDHAEGYQTTASGGCAHAEGAYTVASGLDSHAEGDSTIANHLAQHVFGQYNIADTSTATAANRGNYIEIVGNGSYNARSNARTLDWSGNEVLTGKLTVGAVGVNSMDVATVGQLPTKTSDLTNDSGFITTDNDEKLKTIINNNTNQLSHYIIFGSNSKTASTKYIDTTGLTYSSKKGTPSVDGHAILGLGNSTGSGTAGNKQGILRLNSNTIYNVTLKADNLTNTRTILFPDKAGTIALTSDIPSVPSWALQSTKPTYTAVEVGALPNTTVIPSKTSDLINDSGFITGYTETDPTVPSWAKASTKPTYTASEIGGLLDMFYPIGSYYETSDTSFDPNVTWGGTWALETEGQVHVSSGTNYAVSGALTNTSDGGEENHTLTVNELAKHSHRILQANNSGTAGAWVTDASTTNSRKVAYQGDQTYSDVIELSGGSQPHNIMQPYIVVNRWHRTA